MPPRRWGNYEVLDRKPLIRRLESILQYSTLPGCVEQPAGPELPGVEQADMIIELVSISVPPAKKQELGKALVWLKGALQVQPGCLSCRVLQIWPAQDCSELWRIEARWDGQRNLIRHLQSDTYKRLLQLMELSAAPPLLEFLAVVELRGLDRAEAARISPG